jgi:transcriptional/translational regulatory protein YebC/TACO1
MAEPGAVAWQFERKGVLEVPGDVPEDNLMLVALDAGAEDVIDGGGTWRVITGPSDLSAVREALGAAGIALRSADVTMLPRSVVTLATPDAARRVLRLIDALDEHDDVQDVYANFDIADEILEAVET